MGKKMYRILTKCVVFVSATSPKAAKRALEKDLELHSDAIRASELITFEEIEEYAGGSFLCVECPTEHGMPEPQKCKNCGSEALCFVPDCD